MRLITTDRRTIQTLYAREVRTLKRAVKILEAYQRNAEGERFLAAQHGAETIERLLDLEGVLDA